MNLERISIKVVGRESVFMTLAKISDFSKLYTTILFDQDLTMQKINTGDSVLAFNFKNIEQFKGFRPFRPYNQDELFDLYKTYGTSFLYQTKLHSGDLVRYNGLKYVVLGIVVNTYAQWNMPTPLLFNPTNVNNDYKSLYGSKLTEEKINNKINDNFQAGKYDADMVIPLVDANDFSEYITVIQPRPTKEEVDLMFDSVKAEKDLTIKSQKDVFIDTMLRLRGNEINQIKEVNEDLFKGVQTLLLSVNKAVNEQIELLPAPVVEKPARKPRAKKIIEEQTPFEKVLSDDLPDFIKKQSEMIIMPTPIQKLAFHRVIEQENKISETDFLQSTLSSNMVWRKTAEGHEFWFDIHNNGDLREFKKRFGNKGELVETIISEKQIQEPVIETQEVKYVEVIIYPPKGGVLYVKVFNVVEMVAVLEYLWKRLDVRGLTLNFSAITDSSQSTTQITVKTSESGQKIFSNLIQQYDTFVKPPLDWSKFDVAKTDYERIALNEEILKDAFNIQPVEVEKLKPVPVEKPKPVKVEKPKPVPVEKPKPVKVEKQKPVKVEKPKPVKAVKPKVTKEIVEDDLSFLDDLDNIF